MQELFQVDLFNGFFLFTKEEKPKFRQQKAEEIFIQKPERDNDIIPLFELLKT